MRQIGLFDFAPTPKEKPLDLHDELYAKLKEDLSSQKAKELRTQIDDAARRGDLRAEVVMDLLKQFTEKYQTPKQAQA